MQQNRRQSSQFELRELVAIGRLLAFRLNLIANERDRTDGPDVARLERQLSLAWEDALERFQRRNQPAHRTGARGSRLSDTAAPATGTSDYGDSGKGVVKWLAADTTLRGDS